MSGLALQGRTYNYYGLDSGNNSGTRLPNPLSLDYFTFFVLCRENYCRNLHLAVTRYCRMAT
jgi:hypothetical protein